MQKFIFWSIAIVGTFVGISWAFTLMSEASTIANLGGAFLIALYIYGWWAYFKHNNKQKNNGTDSTTSDN